MLSVITAKRSLFMGVFLGLVISLNKPNLVNLKPISKYSMFYLWLLTNISSFLIVN